MEMFDLKQRLIPMSVEEGHYDDTVFSLFGLRDETKPYFNVKSIYNFKNAGKYPFINMVLMTDKYIQTRNDYRKLYLYLIEKNTLENLNEKCTPYLTLKCAIDILEPKFGEKIYDPDCGLGDLLIETYDRLKKKHPYRKELEEETIFYDGISQKYRDIFLFNSYIRNINLEKYDNEDEIGFECIVCDFPKNPFLRKSDMKIPNINLELGRQEFALIRKIYDRLKEGGRACIIVSQNIIKNETEEYVANRKYMIENMNIKLIVDLSACSSDYRYLVYIVKNGRTKEIGFRNLIQIDEENYLLKERVNADYDKLVEHNYEMDFMTYMVYAKIHTFKTIHTRIFKSLCKITTVKVKEDIKYWKFKHFAIISKNKEMLDDKYLYYYLKHTDEALLEYEHKQTKQELQYYIKKEDIYFPPIEEQREITDQLDFIYEECIQTNKEKIKQLRELNRLCIDGIIRTKGKIADYCKNNCDIIQKLESDIDQLRATGKEIIDNVQKTLYGTVDYLEFAQMDLEGEDKNQFKINANIKEAIRLTNIEVDEFNKRKDNGEEEKDNGLDNSEKDDGLDNGELDNSEKVDCLDNGELDNGEKVNCLDNSEKVDCLDNSEKVDCLDNGELDNGEKDNCLDNGEKVNGLDNREKDNEEVDNGEKNNGEKDNEEDNKVENNDYFDYVSNGRIENWRTVLARFDAKKIKVKCGCDGMFYDNAKEWAKHIRRVMHNKWIKD
jgi:hypothetical protein